MVSPSYIAVFARLIEVIIKGVIHLVATFCCFHHDEAEWRTVDSCMLKGVPIYRSLIMRNVDASHFKAVRIFLVAIPCTPTETGRAYKEVVERPHIERQHQDSAYPPGCGRMPAQETRG